jgi:hypothetical protein
MSLFVFDPDLGSDIKWRVLHRHDRFLLTGIENPFFLMGADDNNYPLINFFVVLKPVLESAKWPIKSEEVIFSWKV